MDEVVLDGKTYRASKKAALECGYTQDYVGQLCRGGHIDARRVSGHWYVNIDSIKEYKAKADLFKPEPPKYAPDPNVESSLNLEGKEYVSAAKAAKLADYAQDYVGQLARAGKIPSKQIGNRWYVEKDALLAHRSEKDALLAAVQAESVGLKRPVQSQISTQVTPLVAVPSQFTANTSGPLLSYMPDERDLLPVLRSIEEEIEAIPTITVPEKPIEVPDSTFISAPIAKVSIPINVIRTVKVEPRSRLEITPKVDTDYTMSSNRIASPMARKTIFSNTFLASAFTIVLVAAVGVTIARTSDVYTFGESISQTATGAAAFESLQRLADSFEDALGMELVYVRGAK